MPCSHICVGISFNALKLTDDLLTRSWFDTNSTPIQHFTGTHTRQHPLLSAIDAHLRGRESVHIHMKIHMHKHTCICIHTHTHTHTHTSNLTGDAETHSHK